jgi:hypothetical protein
MDMKMYSEKAMLLRLDNKVSYAPPNQQEQTSKTVGPSRVVTSHGTGSDRRSRRIHIPITSRGSSNPTTTLAIITRARTSRTRPPRQSDDCRNGLQRPCSALHDYRRATVYEAQYRAINGHRVSARDESCAWTHHDVSGAIGGVDVVIEG